MKKISYEYLFRLLVAGHLIFIVLNVAAMFVLPLCTEWYIWCPLESFLLNLMANNAFKDCPMTRLENYIRGKIGRVVIKSFVGHYIIKTILRFKRKFK